MHRKSEGETESDKFNRRRGSAAARRAAASRGRGFGVFGRNNGRGSEENSQEYAVGEGEIGVEEDSGELDFVRPVCPGVR